MLMGVLYTYAYYFVRMVSYMHGVGFCIAYSEL